MTQRLAWWQWAWLLLAAASLPPATYWAYQALQETDRSMHVQLIQRYSLWETDPRYAGTPESWTRFAAMLLSTRQLMRRVREKHGALADQIEQDFQLDAVIAQSKVVAAHLAAWGAPLALFYAVGWFMERRKRRNS